MSKEKFWLPLCILTVAGFTFNTSELIPIGLLSDIAGSFGVSEARAGLLITVYAWVVALMSLPLMLLFARMEFRKLMIGVVSVFFLSHVATVMSTGYYSLMGARISTSKADGRPHNKTYLFYILLQENNRKNRGGDLFLDGELSTL